MSASVAGPLITAPVVMSNREPWHWHMIVVPVSKPPESGPCEPFANHGYFGKEAETVDAIAAWMLGKPFPKEIR